MIWQKNLDCKPLTACKENSGLLPTRQRWNCCSAKMTPLFPPTLAIIYPLVNKHRPWKSPIFNGNQSSNHYLPGSMLIYQRVNHIDWSNCRNPMNRDIWALTPAQPRLQTQPHPQTQELINMVLIQSHNLPCSHPLKKGSTCSLQKSSWTRRSYGKSTVCTWMSWGVSQLASNPLWIWVHFRGSIKPLQESIWKPTAWPIQVGFTAGLPSLGLVVLWQSCSYCSPNRKAPD